MSPANLFAHKEMVVIMRAMRYNSSKPPDGSLSLPLLFLWESVQGVVTFINTAI